MNKFESLYKKQYSGINPFSRESCLITAREKVASIINDSWIYSVYWKNETWVEQAIEDLQKRKIANAKEAELLRTAEYILNDITE